MIFLNFDIAVLAVYSAVCFGNCISFSINLLGQLKRRQNFVPVELAKSLCSTLFLQSFPTWMVERCLGIKTHKKKISSYKWFSFS